MKYHELKVNKNKPKTRVGRGIAAGKGKTAGRGTKGQKARTGATRKPGFEGGQNPLMQRLPKLRGFTSQRAKVEEVKTSTLNNLNGVIDNFKLYDAGLLQSPYTKAKLIYSGEITKKLEVKLQAATSNSIDALQKKGGKFTLTSQVKRQKSVEKTK
jgi:large subunit ribosomal protein L15